MLHAAIAGRDGMSKRRPRQAHASNTEKRTTTGRHDLGNRLKLIMSTSSADLNNQGDTDCIDYGTVACSPGKNQPKLSTTILPIP